MNHTEAANKIDWQNCNVGQFTGSGPVLVVKDDAETYCATIPDGTDPREMCKEFCHTYDTNGATDCEIPCSASIYDDGGDTWNERPGDGFGFTVIVCADGETMWAF